MMLVDGEAEDELTNQSNKIFKNEPIGQLSIHSTVNESTRSIILEHYQLSALTILIGLLLLYF